jgi:hypothetical protein
LCSFRGCVNQGYAIGAVHWHAIANQILPQPAYGGLVDAILEAALPIVLGAVIIAKPDQGSR